MFPYGSSKSNKENVCPNTSNSHYCGHCDVWAYTVCSSLGKYVRFKLTEFKSLTVGVF